MRIVDRGLQSMNQTEGSAIMESTHPHDFVGNLLRLPFPLLIIRTRSIKFGSVKVLVERGLHTKLGFIHCKLVPCPTRTGVKGKLVGEAGGVEHAGIWRPRLEFSLATR